MKLKTRLVQTQMRILKSNVKYAWERERDYEDGEAAKDIERGYASVAALLLLLFCFSLAYELVIGHSHGEERCVVNHGKRDLYAQRIRTLWFAASDSPTAQRKWTKRMNTKRQRYWVFFYYGSLVPLSTAWTSGCGRARVSGILCEKGNRNHPQILII